MTQIRLDPLGLIKSIAATATATTNKPRAETARQNNTVLGECPVCSKPMQLANANGIASYVCMEHCVCLPTKD